MSLLATIIGNRRRAFSPRDLAPALWLDASDPTTLLNGSAMATPDQAISQWSDKSGNGRHATQATGVSQPRRKTAVQNGRDVVRFDGVDDYLTGSLTIAKPFTWLVIYSTQNVTPGYVFVLTDANALISGYSSGFCEYFNYPRISAGSVASNDFALRSVVYPSTGTVSARKNGVETGTGAVGSPGFSGSFTVAKSATAREYINGDIAEILVFPTALSDSDRIANELYLAYKWNLPHPLKP